MTEPYTEKVGRFTTAAEVVQEFAGPDSAAFDDFLAEFDTLSSRGNLRVILWSLAEHLLAQASSSTPETRPCKGTNANVCVAEGCFGEACRSTSAKEDS